MLYTRGMAEVAAAELSALAHGGEHDYPVDASLWLAVEWIAPNEVC